MNTISNLCYFLDIFMITKTHKRTMQMASYFWQWQKWLTESWHFSQHRQNITCFYLVACMYLRKRYFYTIYNGACISLIFIYLRLWNLDHAIPSTGQNCDKLKHYYCDMVWFTMYVYLWKSRCLSYRLITHRVMRTSGRMLFYTALH